ncbi:MAG: hypothetical protein J5608_00700 [Alphaproteobacteria bacterium]|nr:hypothetical protein [Alphaproteobacteria bacterium]
MKKYLSLLVLCLFVMPAFGAGRSMVGTSSARSSIAPAAARSAATNTSAAKTATATTAAQESSTDETTEQKPEPVNRDAEKLACLSNNIGMGNTFVWASRDSNTSNYSTMIEDTEHPENNVCFVLVNMRTDDARINISDIQPHYFQWGQAVTCGSWVDEEKMKDRILDAKKKARVWGTIGGSVGGAGLGVGAMELFGNKLIGGKVMGQKQYEEYSVDWYRVKANELMQKDPSEYDRFVDLIADLKKECTGASVDAKCNDKKYKTLMQLDLKKYAQAQAEKK